MGALRLLTTLLVPALVRALGGAARTLAGTADFVRFEFALLVVWLVRVIAALIFALVIVSTVTLLSWLYQAVTADRLARLHKAVAPFLLQNLADVANTAHRELVVV